MGALENPDLHAPAVQIVCLSCFAQTAALWGKAGFGQSNCYLAPESNVLVCASGILGVASIFFKRPLRGLLSPFAVRVANDSEMVASAPQFQPRFKFGKHWLVRRYQKLDADYRPVVLGHGGSVFLGGTSRQVPNF